MDLVEQLRQVNLFSQLAPADIQALESHLKPHTFRKDEVLFREDDPGDTMYIIRSGKIRIYTQDPRGRDMTLFLYGVNEIFGELTLIDERPRSASAMAAEDLDVLELTRAEFLKLLDERPQVGMAMMRGLSERIRSTTTFLEEHRPKQFDTETTQTDLAEVFRQPAQPEIAEIIQQIRPRGQSSPVESAVAQENPYEQLLQPEPKPHAPSVFDAALAKTEELSTDRNPSTQLMRSRAAGIFDRLSANLGDTDKPKTEDKGQDDE